MDLCPQFLLWWVGLVPSPHHSQLAYHVNLTMAHCPVQYFGSFIHLLIHSLIHSSGALMVSQTDGSELMFLVKLACCSHSLRCVSVMQFWGYLKTWRVMITLPGKCMEMRSTLFLHQRTANMSLTFDSYDLISLLQEKRTNVVAFT